MPFCLLKKFLRYLKEEYKKTEMEKKKKRVLVALIGKALIATEIQHKQWYLEQMLNVMQGLPVGTKGIMGDEIIWERGVKPPIEYGNNKKSY